MVNEQKTEQTSEIIRSIILTNNIEQINSLHEFVDSIGEELKLSPALTLNLNLALEEIVSNVILYAYSVVSPENRIFIEFIKNREQFKIYYIRFREAV